MKRLKSVSCSITIQKPQKEVWEVWSKFVNVSDYIASIPVSYGIGDIETGVGTRRRCEISEKMIVEERITRWHEGTGYSMEVYHSTGTPIDKLTVDFELKQHGDGTVAEITINYQMKGILDYLPMKPLFRKQAKEHLIGLKYHLETDEKVTENMMNAITKNSKYNLAVC